MSPQIEAVALKACPFCAAPPIDEHFPDGGGFVMCNNDACPIEPETDEATYAEAIAAWNTRLSTPVSDEGEAENLALALANDPRTATPLEASNAKLALTAMFSHRGDGIPTQYVHGAEVAGHARTMWAALITALRSPIHADASPSQEGFDRAPRDDAARIVALDTGREIARLIASYACTFVSGSREHGALLRAEQIALCPCDHDWEESVSSQFSSETQTDVSCTKCHMPGSLDNASREVYWPAT